MVYVIIICAVVAIVVFSYLAGTKKDEQDNQPLDPETEHAINRTLGLKDSKDREYELAKVTKFNGRKSIASPTMSSNPAKARIHRDSLYSHVDQAQEQRRKISDMNALIKRNSAKTYQVYTYDGTPLRGISKGQTIVAQEVARPHRMTNSLTGNTWDPADGGTAFSYKGKQFGVVFARSMKGCGSITMRRTGTYAGRLPEMVVEIQQPCALQDYSYWTPRNDKPTGLPEMKMGSKVAVTGEEMAQELLRQYDDNALVWATLRHGTIPKGKSKDKPTLWVSVNGIDVGWLTELQGEKHCTQIPDKGAVCLARIKAGTKKMEVIVNLPRA